MRKVILASCRAFASQPTGKAQKAEHSATAVSELKAIYAKTLKFDKTNVDVWRGICNELKGFVKTVSW